jgi:hypothetical protein
MLDTQDSQTKNYSFIHFILFIYSDKYSIIV